MDPYSPNIMAQQLKMMEVKAKMIRKLLPNAKRLANPSLEQLADEYWDAVKKYL